MVATIRERMARVNAEKLAENKRPKQPPIYWRGILLDDSSTELPDDIGVISDSIIAETYIGDSTDIFDADDDDIGAWIAFFYPDVYASFDADNPAYD